MRRSLYVIAVAFFISACGAAVNETGRKNRVSAVAGQFYPADPGKLSDMIDEFMKIAKEKVPEVTDIGGIIVPHAGYIYSGRTAGYGFSPVKNREFSTVILLGPSHHRFLGKPTVSTFRTWETPFGKVEVDNGLLKDIKENPGFSIDDSIFVPEHSLEVEVPFMQKSLKKGFRLLPILINEFSVDKLKPYSRELADILKKREKILFVMSTDMSHYFNAGTAREMDKKVIDAIKHNDLNKLEEILVKKDGQLCGAGGVMLGLLTLKELGYSGIAFLDYSHSGMVSGDNSRVVGYGAFVVYRQPEKINRKLPGNQEEEMGYTREQKVRLLEIARDSMTSYITKGKKIDIKVEDSELAEKRGAFVTLHMNGRLRGCIGSIMPVDELYLTIRDMAVQSSTRDPRFPSVTENELEHIEIEISVLTVPKKVSGSEEIVIGRDGVIVKKGFHQGVYLPQVADETGWSKDEFLSSLCYSKAGLPKDAWKDPETELYTFQAEVFNEKEMNIR
ncbi:MAG: AmmeMemoRadiSam system protein B [Elusimicrobiota bacterium]